MRSLPERMRFLHRRPVFNAPALRQYEGPTVFLQRGLEFDIGTISTVGHSRLEADAGCLCLLNESKRNARLGAKRRILPAASEPASRRIRHHMQGIITTLICPQAGHCHNAIVGFADRAQILARDVIGGVALFAIAGVIDHQHALVGGTGRGIGRQQLQPALI